MGWITDTAPALEYRLMSAQNSWSLAREGMIFQKHNAFLQYGYTFFFCMIKAKLHDTTLENVENKDKFHT